MCYGSTIDILTCLLLSLSENLLPGLLLPSYGSTTERERHRCIPSANNITHANSYIASDVLIIHNRPSLIELTLLLLNHHLSLRIIISISTSNDRILLRPFLRTPLLPLISRCNLVSDQPYPDAAKKDPPSLLPFFELALSFGVPLFFVGVAVFASLPLLSPTILLRRSAHPSREYFLVWPVCSATLSKSI